MFDNNKNNAKDSYVMAAKTTPLFRGAFTGGAYEQAMKLSNQIKERNKLKNGRFSKE